MAKKTFTFDNKSSADFGLFINGRGVFDSPEPDLEYVSIPGRSGDLIYDNKRFNNIGLTYPACFMLTNFTSNFKSLQAFLLKHKGYYKLTDDYEPNYFRMASVAEAIKLKDIDWVYDAGSFDLTFNCKPQRFLVSGETETDYTAASQTITNPTDFASKPLLKVYGTGTVTIGGVTLTIVSHGFAYIEIDCELMDCYYQGNNANQYVTIGNYFPELPAGNSTLAINGPSKVIVKPRWWTV